MEIYTFEQEFLQVAITGINFKKFREGIAHRDGNDLFRRALIGTDGTDPRAEEFPDVIGMS